MDACARFCVAVWLLSALVAPRPVDMARAEDAEAARAEDVLHRLAGVLVRALPRHAREHSPQQLAAVTKHVANEPVEAVEVVDAAASNGIEIESHDGRLDLRPRPEDRRREHTLDRAAALGADPDRKGIVERRAGRRGHAFAHLALHGDDRRVERPRQGQEIGDHRCRHAVREVGDEEESASCRREGLGERREQGGGELVLAGEGIAE